MQARAIACVAAGLVALAATFCPLNAWKAAGHNTAAPTKAPDGPVKP